jgi:putative acetyltransferase
MDRNDDSMAARRHSLRSIGDGQLLGGDDQAASRAALADGRVSTRGSGERDARYESDYDAACEAVAPRRDRRPGSARRVVGRMRARMIREARPSDFRAIRAVVRHAFGGQAEEADLVERLRADRDVLVELVAASGPAIQGHVLYSTLPIEQDGETLQAAALAPVSVLPVYQRSGIGSELIRTGNRRCADVGCVAVVVLGHAEYYPRFGFSPKIAESLQAPFSGRHFMALEFEPGVLARGGQVRYAKAFGVRDERAGETGR